MCRKPSQHSSHLLPSHSPELHQQSHSLTSCTDNPMPLVYSPTKIQKCYKLFRFGAGQLQVNPLSILLGCSSLVMLESAPWCSCLGLPAKPRKERDALNSTIQMENSMENTTSLSTSSWSWCSDEDWWRQTRAILETEAKNPYSSGLSAKETVNTQWDGKAENQKHSLQDRAQEGTKRHRGKGAHGLGIWHVATGMYNGASGATGWEAAPHRVAERDYFMSWTRAQGWAFTHLQGTGCYIKQWSSHGTHFMNKNSDTLQKIHCHIQGR